MKIKLRVVVFFALTMLTMIAMIVPIWIEGTDAPNFSILDKSIVTTAVTFAMMLVLFVIYLGIAINKSKKAKLK